MAEADDAKELLVVSFPDENKAQQVLDTLQQLENAHAVDLHNAAVIKRSANGETSIHESHDFSDKTGIVAGALAGGLLGMLKGHGIAGVALGAGTGFAVSKIVDLGFSDEYLRQVAERLQPGSSALVAAITFEQVDQAMAVLDQFDGGHILRQSLPDDVAQKLSQAIED